MIPNPPISEENSLSITLYTDYDSLSYQFGSTFHAVSENKNNEYTTRRNQNCRNWSKTLCEIVNAFGTGINDARTAAFYHGVSAMYFNLFRACFNSPTSTTTRYQLPTDLRQVM